MITFGGKFENLNMKKISVFCTLMILIAVFRLSAQEKGSIGFSFSGLNSNMILQSAATNHDYMTKQGHGFLSFTADYLYPINNWIEFETGINYSFQSFSEMYDNPNFAYVTLTAPEPKYYDINMVNIPVGLRVDFLKYGFVNSGILVDLTNEPGIGSYFGAGMKIESEVGMGLYVNPYVKIHSIVPVNFNQNVDRIIETGIKIGVTYNFDNPYSKRR